MEDMRTGGKSAGYVADAIVVSSNPFRSSGERYLKMEFPQR